jgi:V/A-type H+-transporting ATPase subunit D
MIHPTRTNLLLLKDKVLSINNSIEILTARRQALIMELMQSSTPYLESRKKLGLLYGEAITRLAVAQALSGGDRLQAMALTAQRDLRVTVSAKSVWGLPYKEISPDESAVRSVTDRGYDFRLTTPAVEEAAFRFERVVDDVLALAEYENKIYRLGREIQKTTRRMRVLEEKILPQVKRQIKNIAGHIAERERETHYRLKEFKKAQTRDRGIGKSA